METNGRDQIVVEAPRAKTQHDNEFSQGTNASLRKVAVARIGAANMCSERAVYARRIAFVCELILLGPGRIHPGDRLCLDWHQRVACFRSAHHLRPQLVGLREISTGLLIEELPKLPNILFQLPHDEIGAVTAKIFSRRRILRRKQSRVGGIGFQQRPIRYFSVFVAIAEQEFTQRNDVRVFHLTAWRSSLLLPVDLRLAGAVGETERFILVEIAGATRRSRRSQVAALLRQHWLRERSEARISPLPRCSLSQAHTRRASCGHNQSAPDLARRRSPLRS